MQKKSQKTFHNLLFFLTLQPTNVLNILLTYHFTLMKRFLRYSLVALMAMVFGNVSAQEATIDFSGPNDDWGIGTTKIVEAKEFTYNGLTIKLEGTEGNGYRWYDSGNIILGKKGATLTLPAFNFDVERIDVVGTSGASASVTQNIFVGDEAVSTETTGAKDVTNEYKIAADKQAAGTVYVLKVTSNHNTQITKILIWKKGTTGDDPEPEIQEINVAKSLEIINALQDGAKTNEEYKITGYVVTVTEISTSYGNATFTIADEKGGSSVLTVFRAKDADGQNITDENLLKTDDLVVVQGKLQKYVKNDVMTPEVAQGGKILTVNGNPTGIHNIEVSKSSNGTVYNLAGQKVDQSYKGIVIKNGNKYMQK